MAPTIIVQFDPTPRPVASYSELWGKDPKTLSHWCVKGWIPGAFKHESGAWWVQPLALLSWQPTEPEDVVQNDEREEEVSVFHRVRGWLCNRRGHPTFTESRSVFKSESTSYRAVADRVGYSRQRCLCGHIAREWVEAYRYPINSLSLPTEMMERLRRTGEVEV